MNLSVLGIFPVLLVIVPLIIRPLYGFIKSRRERNNGYKADYESQDYGLKEKKRLHINHPLSKILLALGIAKVKKEGNNI